MYINKENLRLRQRPLFARARRSENLMKNDQNCGFVVKANFIEVKRRKKKGRKKRR